MLVHSTWAFDIQIRCSNTNVERRVTYTTVRAHQTQLHRQRGAEITFGFLVQIALAQSSTSFCASVPFGFIVFNSQRPKYRYGLGISEFSDLHITFTNLKTEGLHKTV
jgi:hypothetical protein